MILFHFGFLQLLSLTSALAAMIIQTVQRVILPTKASLIKKKKKFSRYLNKHIMMDIIGGLSSKLYLRSTNASLVLGQVDFLWTHSSEREQQNDIFGLWYGSFSWIAQTVSLKSIWRDKRMEGTNLKIDFECTGLQFF